MPNTLDRRAVADALAVAVEMLLRPAPTTDPATVKTVARVALEHWHVANGLGDPVPAMPLPSLHTNGSGKRELLDGIVSALEGLRIAQERLRHASPNGRDYYPQGPGALGRADAWHRARCYRVYAVEQELQALAEAIDAGGFKVVE